jgi:transcription elongation GreA/GreB family factor
VGSRHIFKNIKSNGYKEISMLKDISKEIDEKLAVEYQNWKAQAEEIDSDIAEEQKILASDEAQTDRSENAVYQIAKDRYAKLQISKRDVDNKIDAYDSYNIEYVPGDYITVGSTIKLTLLTENKKPTTRQYKEFFIKLVPEDLGSATIGAIPLSSAVGRALPGKYTGDKIKVQTRTGELEYLIEEVY